MQAKLITLLGATRETENYGVKVLLSAAIETLAKAHPQATIAQLDYAKEPGTWIEDTPDGEKTIQLINLRFSWRLWLPNNIFRLVALVAVSRLLPKKLRNRIWLRHSTLGRILEAECHYSLAGGDSFSDIYGLRRMLYVSLPQILVLLMQRPLVLLPQTYGPFKGWPAKAVARFIIHRAKDIYSRDAAGAQTVRGLLRNPELPVKVVPDLGMGMSAGRLPKGILDSIQGLKQATPLVGLNVSKLLFMGGYSRGNMFGLRESYTELTAALIRFLTHTLKVNVVLIPHVCGGLGSQEDETSLCRALVAQHTLQAEGRLHYFDEALDHRQTKALIGLCDLFVGARMHACIGAVSQNIPAVCLAYSSKFAGVMEPLGPGAAVVDLRASTIKNLLSVVHDRFHRRKDLGLDLERRVTRANPHFPGLFQTRINEPVGKRPACPESSSCDGIPF